MKKASHSTALQRKFINGSTHVPEQQSFGLRRPLLRQPANLLHRILQPAHILHQTSPIHRDLFSLLEEFETRNTGNRVSAGDGLHIVNVDFDKGQDPRNSIRMSELREDWSNGSTGTAPVGVEVDDDVCRGSEDGVEFGFGFGMLKVVSHRIQRS